MTSNIIKEIFQRSQAYGTWCSEAKARELHSIVSSYEDPVIVEIGVFMGQSAFITLETMRRLSIPGSFFAVDPWTTGATLEGLNSQENDEWWSSIDIDEIYENFLRCIADNKFGGLCNVVRKKSEDFHYDWKGQPIDILHIDGNHSEEQSVNDVLLWSNSLSIGGTIIMDDTGWDTTQKAVALLDVLFDKVEDPSHKENNFQIYKNNG